MKKRKVIIDCDPGIDDSLAIMLALQSEELEVVGITIVCGNCPVEMGFGNAKKVLKHMDRLDVPVYIGAEKPLRREYVNALHPAPDCLSWSQNPGTAAQKAPEIPAASRWYTRFLRQTPCRR